MAHLILSFGSLHFHCDLYRNLVMIENNLVRMMTSDRDRDHHAVTHAQDRDREIGEERDDLNQSHEVEVDRDPVHGEEEVDDAHAQIEDLCHDHHREHHQTIRIMLRKNELMLRRKEMISLHQIHLYILMRIRKNELKLRIASKNDIVYLYHILFFLQLSTLHHKI